MILQSVWMLTSTQSNSAFQSSGKAMCNVRCSMINVREDLWRSPVMQSHESRMSPVNVRQTLDIPKSYGR